MSALLDDNAIRFTESQNKAVLEFQEIMKEYPTINFQEDLTILTKYLRISDWDPKEATNKLVHVYEMKKDYPGWYANKKVSEYLPFIKKHTRYMLPDRDRNGRRIFVYKLENFSVPGLSLKLSAQIDELWYEAMLMDQATQSNGISVIVDCKHISKSLIKWLIPSEMKVAAAKTNVFPCKTFDVHLVNLTSFMNIITKAASPLLHEHIKRKFHFHQSNWTQLHEFLGKDCLPEEYGGPSSKRVEHEQVYKFLMERENIIFDNTKYGMA